MEHHHPVADRVNLVTPSPTPPPRPAVSCPKMRGAECDPVAIFFRSVPQMPQVCTLTSNLAGADLRNRNCLQADVIDCRDTPPPASSPGSGRSNYLHLLFQPFAIRLLIAPAFSRPVAIGSGPSHPPATINLALPDALNRRTQVPGWPSCCSLPMPHRPPPEPRAQRNMRRKRPYRNLPSSTTNAAMGGIAKSDSSETAFTAANSSPCCLRHLRPPQRLPYPPRQRQTSGPIALLPGLLIQPLLTTSILRRLPGAQTRSRRSTTSRGSPTIPAFSLGEIQAPANPD